MNIVLPLLALMSTGSILFFRWKQEQSFRQKCGARIRKSAFHLSWGEKVTRSIKREAEYATPDIQHVYPITITATLLLMFIGVIVGQIFHSYFFSVVLMLVFGIFPWMILRYLSIRKLMKLEMELPTFVTDLVHHLRDKKDMKLALMSCEIIPHIQKEQIKMRSDLDNNYMPDEALIRMYERTRSRWFLLIAQMAAIMEERSDLSAVMKQFMTMQLDIQRANARIQKAFERTKKKARMLLLIEAVFFLTLYMSVKMIQDPWYYFTETEQGQFQLLIGFILAIFPVGYLIYLFLRRR